MSSSTAPGEVRARAERPRELLRLTCAAFALAALQLIAHRAALASSLGGAAVLAPLLLPGALVIWLGFLSSAAFGVAACVAVGALASLALRYGAAAQLLPLVCQLAVCLAIAWLFGRTLLPGAVPLVTQMARAVHGTLPVRIEAYTRHVTLAWTAFMAILAVSSVLLFALAPLRAWSVFANLLLLPLVALMFLAEYAYRSVRHAWFPHATLLQSVTAFQRLRNGTVPGRGAK
jgi:uncharacterized membrane protein